MSESNSTAISFDGTSIKEYSRVEAGLATLRDKYADVVWDVSSTKALDAAKEARAEIRAPRYEVEKLRQSLKAPAIAYGKAIDSEAKRITDAILLLEGPVDAAIKAEEARREKEKQDRIAAEKARTDAIQARIEGLRGVVTAAATAGAERIAGHIATVEGVEVDESFAEFQETALAAKDTALLRLRELHAAAVEREAEAARLKAEREQLERDQAEQRRLDAEARERREQEEAEAKRLRDVEQAEIQRQRDELARQQREHADKVEADRIAALPPITPAAASPAPAEVAQLVPAKVTAIHHHARPSDAEIVSALCQHFNESHHVVIGWLVDFDARQLAA